jgi:hypothetical protein
MRCFGALAAAQIVDTMDTAHEFIVAAIVVMVLSCVWGSFTDWQETEGLKAQEASTAGSEGHSREWSVPNRD